MKIKNLFVSILLLCTSFVIVGCGSKSYEASISKKLAQQPSVLNVFELTGADWTDLRILKPYQSKQFFGEKFEQSNDGACLWVFTDNEKVVESFEILRNTADCLDLPNKTYTRGQTIFLLRDGKLQERKKIVR
jgi:hypothetical protein